MSGRAAIRGFHLQTLTILLEVVAAEGWESVTLEPGDDSEEFDFFFEYDDRVDRVQVKSTLLAFSSTVVDEMAKKLAQVDVGGKPSDRRLVLLGNLEPKFSLKQLAEIGAKHGVAIDPPQTPDTRLLTAAAAQRLDEFLAAHHISRVPSVARELLVRGLADNFTELSGAGSTETRELNRPEFPGGSKC